MKDQGRGRDDVQRRGGHSGTRQRGGLGGQGKAMKGADIVSLVREAQDLSTFRDLHWEGSFEDYLDLVAANPRIARSAFQRVYDMITSHGSHTYVDGKKRITHYKFFDDVSGGGRDAVFGLEIPLMRLVNVFKSAARRYGTERRIILLHGPVGSSKSTIVRLMKRGMEEDRKSVV